MTEYLVLDVFTDQAFSGNQLAVIPDATGLAESDLLKIAREFNYSETAFVYPPENPNHTAKIRIFTPSTEVPFAGHPTIGTAVALAQAGKGPQIVLETQVGAVHCRATATEAEFLTNTKLEILAHPDPNLVAQALGLSSSRICRETHMPILATVGLPFTLTELRDRKSLSDIRVDIAAFRVGKARHAAALDFAQFAYVREGDTIHARMFAPLDNIPEDPATGSAAAALTAFLGQFEPFGFELKFHQGDDINRPSVIHTRSTEEGVQVMGKAVLVMRGTLFSNV